MSTTAGGIAQSSQVEIRDGNFARTESQISVGAPAQQIASKCLQNQSTNAALSSESRDKHKSQREVAEQERGEQARNRARIEFSSTETRSDSRHHANAQDADTGDQMAPRSSNKQSTETRPKSRARAHAMRVMRHSPQL